VPGEKDGVLYGLDIPIKIGTQVGQVTQIDISTNAILINWGRKERGEKQALRPAQWIEAMLHPEGGPNVPGEIQELASFDAKFHRHVAYHLLGMAKCTLQGHELKPLIGRGSIYESDTTAWKLIDYAQRVLQMGERRAKPVRGT
jgi:hypothetical protein